MLEVVRAAHSYFIFIFFNDNFIMFSCATPVDFVIYFMALVFSSSSMFHDYIETEKYCVIFIKNVFVQSQGKIAKKNPLSNNTKLRRERLYHERAIFLLIYGLCH